MAMHDDVLYYSTIEDRHLYGVDRRTGEEVWGISTEGIVYGPVPLEGDFGLLIEFMDREPGNDPSMFLRVMDFESREVIWSTDEAMSPPMLAEGVLYYVGSDGIVHGRDVTTGEKTFRLGGL